MTPPIIFNPIRCQIGEGPIWNAVENKLYFTDALGYAIHTVCIETGECSTRPLPISVAALAFDTQNRLIVSHENGVDILNADNSLTPLYDKKLHSIRFANDMKVGPDGALYVGTQSKKRKKISVEIDGKLYRIDTNGKVSVILDGLLLSNGMDWSIDLTKFYHTDSDTHTIKEYAFDPSDGSLSWTGRSIGVRGVDGFCIGMDGCLYAACWGQGHVAVVDTVTLTVTDQIPIPTPIPSSCCFCGKNADQLAVTTASTRRLPTDSLAGATLLYSTNTRGRLPFLFGT